MRNNHLLAVLSLFLLVPASITRAQTVTSVKGLVTADFPTQYGNVKIYLPEDIRPGDVISGTVVVEPKGNNARQTEKNLAELIKHSVSIDGNKFPVIPNASNFKWLVPRDRQLSAPIELLNASSVKVAELKYNFISPVIGTDPFLYDCAVPSHALTASPLSITGNFDGDMTNTQCLLNNQPTQILAESPRQCQVQFPESAKGSNSLQVKENGEVKCSRQISGVDMQVSAGRLNLRKGESTFIDVRITGLENLPDKALLTVTNLSPGVVNMEGGNLQAITLWPLPDSAKGNYSQRFNVISTTAGTFNVNINLDLPEAYQNTTSTPTEAIPPGYKKLSCDCSATVKVTKSGNSFKAAATGECKGAYGIGINTFPRCETQSISYNWNIVTGKENVDIIGKNNSSTVNLRPRTNGNYVICVTVTVICVDGTTCSATACADQSGKPVDHPGTETKPATDPKPPTTGDPTKPPTTTEKIKCECECKVTGKLVKTGMADGKVGYAVIDAKGECKLKPCPIQGSVVQCTVVKLEYSWSIGSGKDVVEIEGAADKSTVSLKIKGPGRYSLNVKITATCSDGSTCSIVLNAEDEIPPPNSTIKGCTPVVTELVMPKMDGGLKSKHIGMSGSSPMYRDDYIALEAEGGDWDQLKFDCIPEKPECPDNPSSRVVPIIGRVRFEWAIEGDHCGSFVQLGCIADSKSAEGDHVIYKPPVVPLPVKNADTTVTCIILLSVIDDGSAATDETVIKKITIKIKRSKSIPDKYTVEISGGSYTLPIGPPKKDNLSTCKTEGPTWVPGTDLKEPVIILPPVTDNAKMVSNQWILLSTSNQPDPDAAVFRCVSASNCPTSSITRSYADKVEYEWKILKGGGRFILTNKGTTVIYEAPESKGDPIDVGFQVIVKNVSGERKDRDNKYERMLIRVYQPGVKLSQPELGWLPEENNSLDLKSELLYKDGEWKPALAHMCRIHYFELTNVSTEKGACLNAPEPRDANDCRDLQLKNEKDHEAWDDVKGAGKCDVKELYQQARTKRPEKEYSITIYSKDFGSYGFLRSFANVNKKTSLDGKPVYISIPVKKVDVTHPQGRAKKTVYPDNRVTIPMDIDENRIADGGWTSTGGVKMTDPLDNKIDDDEKPTGDNFKGDGFTTYEEYRGFKISTQAGVVHQRINYQVKDIFIRNESKLPLDLYDEISGLDAHEITEAQYISDEKRFVNFNFNKTTHLNFEQRGLHLVDKGSHSSLLGIAYSSTGQPTVPNAEIEIRIYTTKIKSVVDKLNKGVIAPRDKSVYADKLAAVVSHELLHGNNVCHHGEGDPDIERSADLIHGLRSGNVDCVMRYDNVGTTLSRIPEIPGTDLCTSAAGTGYNANGQRFGNAADKRGNCRGQIRVSGAGGIPNSCGHR